MIEERLIEPRRITSGKHHFFGYYDKSPWDLAGRRHLAMEVDFLDRQPTRDDAAVIGYVDTDNGDAWTPVAETRAWCWQQGAMAQWLPSDPADTIIYNVREADDRFAAEIRNLSSGETRRLSRPVYFVGDRYGLSLNFARLHQTRPGYGYPDGAEANVEEPHPADDGVWRVDLKTGESELIVSLQRLYENQHVDSMDLGPMWVNHLTYSPACSNFVFLNRWFRQHPRRPHSDRFYRASADGSELRVVHDNNYFSHFCYFSDDRLLGHARKPDGDDAYLMFDLASDAVEPLGEDVFDCDGHCSFSPDRRWMMTDTYADANNIRTLMLYEMATGRRIDIGRFLSPPAFQHGPLRCDLHPRWSRDGRRISIDSAHDGERQVYVLDVQEITGG